MIKSVARCVPCVCLAFALSLSGGCGKKEEPPSAASPSPSVSATRAASGADIEALRKTNVVDVDVESAAKARLSRKIDIVGSFAEFSTVNLAPKTSGRINHVYARMGDSVQKGQLLVEIDPVDLQLQEKLARADLQQQLAVLGMKSPNDPIPDKNDLPDVKKAKVRMDNDYLNFQRRTEERKQDLISQRDLDDARTQYMASRADYENQLFYVDRNLAAVQKALSQLEITRQELSYTKVYSPLDGYVKEQKLYDGDMVSAGTPCLVLVSASPLLLNVDIPQQYSGSFSLGSRLTVSTDAISGRAFDGTITYISPVSQADSRAVSVQAEVANPSNLLKPGMFGKISLIYQNVDVLMVPESAIVQHMGVTKVYVLRENAENSYSAGEVVVTKGDTSEGWVEITGNVSAGDLVVTKGVESLDDKSPVKIISRGSSYPPNAVR